MNLILSRTCLPSKPAALKPPSAKPATSSSQNYGGSFLRADMFWLEADVSEEALDFHMNLNLEPISYQSPTAYAWLDLVTDLVFSDPGYIARLGKHYRLFRSVGGKPAKGSSMRRFRPQ
jgi:hypothetical protein